MLGLGRVVQRTTVLQAAFLGLEAVRRKRGRGGGAAHLIQTDRVMPLIWPGCPQT